MYSLLEYNNNYLKKFTWRRTLHEEYYMKKLLNYYTDKVNDAANWIVANRSLSNNKTTTSESFKYETTRIGRTPANNNTLDTEVVFPLKYLSNL